ncbi:DUF1217 domain-containing protein [Polymorphum gilvum]|uniref:Flagellar basal-body rod protein flgf n=1 Tax=Polymorphum gilvum (strain LMG 25793 / CGMCC 1.9160 / SL003B-26A1) TaxID=991905 RepID=F2J4M0_POLGS|nr:DUF1217 domain-containing protein [Polymorphum gilvum]ADZ72272.1 Flagellar basal-body rod protein flgf [Polymorphum gilvum SL003B-26A1]
MISTLLQYQMVSTNMTRSLDTVASEPTVRRESEYYLANIGKAKSIDDFLGDDRLFKYAMKAFGLQDMDYAKAFMRKVLEEGTDDRNSFANKLADDRYRQFAETFNFTRYGDAATAFTRAQQGVVDAYVRQSLEIQNGESNEGVRLALYFSRKAETIDSAYDILADRALAQVVYAALGLPDEFAMADVDKQAAFIEKRLDLEDFKDPQAVEAFLKRFTTMWDLAKGPPQASVPNLILSGSSATVGVGQDILTSLQGLKLGGL